MRVAITVDLALVDGREHPPTRVRVRAEPGAPANELHEALGIVAHRDQQLFVNGEPLAATIESVGDLDLLEGATLSVGSGFPAPTAVPSSLELRIVGGYGAGGSYPLSTGTYTIGRSAGDDILVSDEVASRSHARLTIKADRTLLLEDLGSRNGTWVEGRRIDGATAIGLGDLVLVGTTVLVVVAPTVERLPSFVRRGRRAFHRQFRAARQDWPEEVAFPAPYEESERPALNLALTLLPALGITVMAALMRRPEFIAFAAMSPLVGLSRAVVQRRTWTKRHNRDEEAGRQARSDAQERLATVQRAERDARRDRDPDLAEVIAQARLLGRRVWERRAADEDFLRLRVGTASLPSSVRVTGWEQVERTPNDGVPVVIDLPSTSNVAVVGPYPAIRSVAAGLVAQLAVREDPSNVKIVVLAGGASVAEWGWASWLPHCRWDVDDPFALVGSDQISSAARLEEVRRLIRARRDEVVGRSRGEVPLPVVVVVIDEVGAAIEAGWSEVLSDGPQVGVHAICLSESQVPSQCDAKVQIDAQEPDRCLVGVRGEQEVDGVTVDLPTPPTLDRLARSLAPLVAAADDGAEQDLPAQLRLLDLAEVPHPDRVAVGAHWAEGSPANAVPIGRSRNGTQELDLPSQGPHALFAGTSGAGKTELIKAMVATYALANHPDDLSFLLIDFKGGSDYKLLERLPHTVSLVTNDDIEELKRQTRLLKAEVARRSAAFKVAGANTLEGYRNARRTQGELPLLPRLVVIADEFAELVDRAPEELDRFVGVARTGRAFGVHLVLATQSPAGKVGPQIAANITLRFCLRTQNRDESFAVIDAPDASRIEERHRGRGFLRAHNESLVEVQTGRVGGPRPGTVTDREMVTASIIAWHEVGRRAAPTRLPEVPEAEQDLWDIREACHGAAQDTGWTTSAIPWPRPLPDVVHLRDLPAGDGGAIGFALLDDPDRARQVGVGLQLGGGHLGIGGSPGTGRTTALRAVTCALAGALPVTDAHVYLLDFGGGGLRPLVDLPHIGGAAFDDWDQASRILTGLGELVADRLEGPAGTGGRQEGADTRPHLVLVIDGLDVVLDEGARYGIVDQLATLLARGQAVGLQAVVAGDRTIATSRIGRLIQHRWVLRFNSEGDYQQLGVSTKGIPKRHPDGRVLLPGDQQAQVAVVGEGSGDVAAIRALAALLGERDRHLEARIRRFSPLPRSVGLDTLLAGGPPPPSCKVPLLLGLAAGDGRPAWRDLDTPPGNFFVGGPPGSGRTTALRAMALALARAGTPVAVHATRGSRLGELAGEGVLSVSVGPLTPQSIHPDARVVLVDDAESFPYDDPGLVDLVASDRGAVIAAAIDLVVDGAGGWVGRLKASRAGLLLSPRSKYDGAPFGRPLPEQVVVSGPPGRGVASWAGRLEVVQVPLA